MKRNLPKRKRNRLENYDYSSCGAYFITVCTLGRRNYFWNNVGAIIDRPQDVELSTYGKMIDQAIQAPARVGSHKDVSFFLVGTGVLDCPQWYNYNAEDKDYPRQIFKSLSGIFSI